MLGAGSIEHRELIYYTVSKSTTFHPPRAGPRPHDTPSTLPSQLGLAGRAYAGVGEAGKRNAEGAVGASRAPACAVAVAPVRCGAARAVACAPAGGARGAGARVRCGVCAWTMWFAFLFYN
jgi:hypothetical protein